MKPEWTSLCTRSARLAATALLVLCSACETPPLVPGEEPEVGGLSDAIVFEGPNRHVLEAEAMTYPPAAAVVAVSAEASGGKYLAVSSNAAITGSLRSEGAERIIVRARRDRSCGETPRLQLKVDGVLQLDVNVHSTAWRQYALEEAFFDGAHALEVAFINNSETPGCDVNVFVDQLAFVGPEGTTHPPPTVVLVEKAHGRPATASSQESASFAAASGNDGSTGTRWASAWEVDGQWWQVDLGAERKVSRVSVNWEASSATQYRIEVSRDALAWTLAAENGATSAGVQTTDFAEQTARYVRLVGVTRLNARWGISFYELEVFGAEDPAPQPAPPSLSGNLALGKPATASSKESSLLASGFGNDGNSGTRWASAWEVDGQWWQVDLGQELMVGRVEVNWEASSATQYRIETSLDGTAWTLAAEDGASAAGVRVTRFTQHAARYVRLTGVTRLNAQWGISFHELEVYSESGASTTLNGSLPRPLIELAAGSPFTTPLPASVPLHSSTEQQAFRSELRFLVNASSTRVEQSQYSASLFIVYRNGDVYDTAGSKKASGVPFIKPSGPIAALNNGLEGRGWPIASWMKPDPGEGHMALYNPETGAYGEFIFASVGHGTLSYSWGGFIADARSSVGTSSQSNPWWGGTAFGLNLMMFTITEHEIRKAVERYQAGDYENAYIPHVIGYEAYRHHPNQWYYPASKTDDMGSRVSEWGVGGDPNRLGNGLGVLRMGGIFRLDPNIDVQTQVHGDGTAFGDMMARIIARTYQKHGATMTDQTEAGFALLAEHVRKTDGTYDTGSFSYGSGAPWSYGSSWLKPMMLQIIDKGWVQFVYTARNLETDTGGAPPQGAYRPPR